MPKLSPLSSLKPWVLLKSEESDWQSAETQLLTNLLGQIQLIRAFEEVLLELAAEGLVHGPVHSSIGQEGGAVGSIISLSKNDAVNGSHRGHHQFLAKAITYVTNGKIDLDNLVDDNLQLLLQRTAAEILGLAQGFSGGRGGSMHLQWLESGCLGTNAIVGGGVPFGLGNAFAQKRSGTQDITITYFGDGATNIGSVLESFNLAAAWKLPVCFFIENNIYAVATNVYESTAESRLSGRALGFGIPSWRIDGMDPLAVHLAMKEAERVMRSGGGPTIIEAEVYRYFHQSGPFPGSAFGYRTKEEESEWKLRDPLLRVTNEMLKRGLIDQAKADFVKQQAKIAMTKVVSELLESDPDLAGKRRIRPELWPDKNFVDVGIRSDLSEIADVKPFDPAVEDFKGTEMKFVDAVASVLDRRMESDSRIIILGEDIHRLNGGTNGATKGLAKKYPDRVLGTPISENAFAGLGGGMAVDGRFRPVVEFMYPDFMWVAADQVFNQIGKCRHMFGGKSNVPLVLRTKVALGSGYGSQHLMDPAGIFNTSPGWRIVSPSNAADYIGLMNAALAINDPILVIEHIELYQQIDNVPEDMDYQLPFGKSAVRRRGRDLTVLTYGAMVKKTLEAVEKIGIDAEVIDLRWLDKASFDWDTVGESIRKTNNVLVVEQGSQGTSYGGWLGDEIQRRLFDYLDQPIARVTGGEASPSISKALERAAMAGVEEIAVGLTKIRSGFGVI
jgi:2-oxoisovalerate dehydrogenase E1 component